jgi:glucosyl-3-phosphoglycerate phosphatase
VAQAARAARLLAGLRPVALVASPLQRAQATARALVEVTGLDLALDERLVERGGGAWEGCTDAEIRTRFPDEYRDWQPAAGERPVEVGLRVAAAVREAVKSLDGGVLVVASHGAAIRAGLAELLELPQEYGDRLGPLGNCAWSVLDEIPAGRTRTGWRLTEHNAGTLPEPVLSDDR